MQKILLGLLLTGAAQAQQTQVDLSSQSKKVDFSSATTTKPVRVGALPPTSVCTAGEMYFNTSATPGQNLYLCTASGWTQLTTSGGGSSGGGGSAATSTSTLTDLAVQRSSTANTLTIGANCSPTAPCNVRFGTRSYPITSGATATLTDSAAQGTGYIYVSTTGIQAVLTVGSTMAVTCSTGCTAISGIAQFPSDSIPLATWTASFGVWDANNGTTMGGFDLRAFLSNKSVIGGLGIVTAEVVGQTIVSADTAVVGVQVGVPTASNSPCTAGMYAFDSGFFYQCVAPLTWRRVAIAAW